MKKGKTCKSPPLQNMMELLIDEVFSFGDVAVHGIFH